MGKDTEVSPQPENEPESGPDDGRLLDAESGANSVGTGVVTVCYWAAAREAAGTVSEQIRLPEGGTLSEVLSEVRRLHSPRLAQVLDAASVLIGDTRAPRENWSTLRPTAGDEVHILPPFAGG